ncbi:Piso0_004734 [Millerozyma farinosa CBS 7064]|uniref:Piso0_004734 protein n=1 Tax=Pichia sorbitophila (strain ATCC MYA-4447 / BCRC 22081 / CBS 7064 / NBRC 10061 / NRRL Y-12695) TaxID=559304 RepID=G8Y6A1_PICSO|nr:Piso0_004734 [Millerozyma farinosa CBS 7064]CCE85162.1 Piso0_004734 [Millerozyma farinosa CBS 7064]
MLNLSLCVLHRIVRFFFTDLDYDSMGRKRYVCVCSNCKASKRKCDRRNPCGNCVKLGKQRTCTYLKDDEKYAPYVISASQPLNMKSFNQQSKAASTMDAMSNHTSSKLFDISYSADSKEMPNYETGHSNRKLNFTTRSLLLNQDRTVNDAHWNISTSLPYTMYTGVNPRIDSCDTVVFTISEDVMRSSLLSHPERSSPLGWMSMTLQDPVLAPLWVIFSEVYNVPRATDLKSESFLKDRPSPNDQKKCSPSIEQQDMNGAYEYQKTSPVINNRVNLSGIDIVSITSKNIPKKIITDKLISNFFEWIYPYMPFLDESFFKVQVSRILEYNSDLGKIKKLNIYDIEDYSYLGILLVLMRITCLANAAIPPKYLNSLSTRDQLNTELPSETIVGQECVENAKILLHLGEKEKQNGFCFFLLKLFLSIHRKYFPDDLDVVDDEEICQINKELIEEAQNVLTPNSLHSINNTQLSFLKKKIWNYLIITDLFQNSSLGSFWCCEKEIALNNDIFESPMSNLIDTVFDEKITKVFFSSCSLYGSLKRLLSMILDRKGAKMSSLCDALTQFELGFLQDLGPLEVCYHISDHIIQEKVFKQTFALKYKLSVSNLLMVIFWNLYIKAERRNINTAYFYLKKSLLTILEIYSSYECLTSDDGCVFTLITNPFFAKFVHRSSQILLALFARVSIIMKSTRYITSAAYESELECFKNNLYHCIRYGYMTLEKQHNSNINVNPLKKLHEILLSLSNSDKFTKCQNNYEQTGFLSYSWLCLFHLKEINDMFRLSFSNATSDTVLREDPILINDFNSEIIMNPDAWNEFCIGSDMFFDTLLEF